MKVVDSATVGEVVKAADLNTRYSLPKVSSVREGGLDRPQVQAVTRLWKYNHVTLTAAAGDVLAASYVAVAYPITFDAVDLQILDSMNLEKDDVLMVDYVVSCGATSGTSTDGTSYGLWLQWKVAGAWTEVPEQDSLVGTLAAAPGYGGTFEDGEQASAGFLPIWTGDPYSRAENYQSVHRHYAVRIPADTSVEGIRVVYNGPYKVTTEVTGVGGHHRAVEAINITHSVDLREGRLAYRVFRGT